MLKVKSLTLSFHTFLGTVHAIRDISFEVGPGEIVAIVGESGCGKSATAQAIMGLSTGNVESGEILLDGVDLLKKSCSEMDQVRGKEIGMIFQDPMTALNPTMKIGAQIMEGIRKHQRLSKKEARRRTLQILHKVGIADPEKRIDQYPHEFSGGQRQRVIIAIALACDPKLLIADEPTTALDVTIQAQILELMQQIQKSTGTSIILITHDLGIVAGICDRVIVMYGGQVVESGTVHQIFTSPFHPYTQGLLRSVPRLDMDKDKELVPIVGSPPSLFNPPSGCGFCARCPKAMRICQTTAPPLFDLGKQHQATCWLKAKNEQAADRHSRTLENV